MHFGLVLRLPLWDRARHMLYPTPRSDRRDPCIVAVLLSALLAGAIATHVFL
jgi:hypothetical protein